MDKLQNLLQRVKTTMSEEDYQDLKLFADSYVCLTGLVEDKNMSIHRLRKLLFGSTTEKTREVIKDNSKENASDQDDSPSAPLPRAKPPPKGHGRNGAKAYAKAETISVPHDSLKSGDPCPDCKQGTVYEQATPGILVRIVGQAPLQAMVYELQKHRCNLCGKVFTAPAPAGVGSKKYDATAASMIALLKYGCGLPFNRLQGLQESLGIPLPASTQWDIVYTTAGQVAPAYDELIRHAAQGEVLYNDDSATS